MLKWYYCMSIILVAVLCFMGTTCTNNKNINEPEISIRVEDIKEIVRGLEDSQTSFDMTAAEFAAGMRIGWNLGNTLDATGGETAWVRHVTNQSNITTLKEVGFNVIRIPVTWYKSAAMDMTTYEIHKSWMDRVEEIVNYAVNENMYIIINSHHDEGIFKFTAAEKEKSIEAFRIIWAQIADRFKDYNEKLIFEALNEPRTKGSPAEWNGGTHEEREILNEYYQVFVDLIRTSGGNNGKRFLLFNSYAASAWGNAVNGLVLPNDTIPDKLIASIHAYEPYNFALRNDSSAVSVWSKSNPADTNQIHNTFNAANNKFIKNGIPVIMGEFGAMNRNNDDSRKEWAEYYVSYARSLGIPCVLWDNGAFSGSGERFAILDRSNNTFPNPLYLEGLIRGTGILE